MTKFYGSKIVGEKKIDSGPGMTWHWADKGGRLYKCTCIPGWRGDPKDKHFHFRVPGRKRQGWEQHRR